MSRPLALCVDDFGAAPGIAEAVHELADAGRLNAVSCLVNGADWARAARTLSSVVPHADIGLHFNLTEGRPLSPELAGIWPNLPSLRRLIVSAHVGLLPVQAVRAELAAQLEAFRAATGSAPRFIDGHQHVHHLPRIRKLVIEAAARSHPALAVRNTGRVLGPGHAVKRALIERTGGCALQHELDTAGLARNAALTGVYDFADPDYGALMRRWLVELPEDGALLFCHPAATGTASGDAIAPARAREFAYLRSARFADDLAAADVTLQPVWRAFSGTTRRG